MTIIGSSQQMIMQIRTTLLMRNGWDYYQCPGKGSQVQKNEKKRAERAYTLNMKIRVFDPLEKVP